jgi:hypothetical protein
MVVPAKAAEAAARAIRQADIITTSSAKAEATLVTVITPIKRASMTHGGILRTPIKTAGPTTANAIE